MICSMRATSAALFLTATMPVAIGCAAVGRTLMGVATAWQHAAELVLALYATVEVREAKTPTVGKWDVN